MFENTTRLQATGGNLNYYWSHQLFGHVWEYRKIPGKPPIIVQCGKAQQDCRQQGKIEVIEATMCENTTRFQASRQLVCNAWKYSKIAGNGEGETEPETIGHVQWRPAENFVLAVDQSWAMKREWPNLRLWAMCSDDQKKGLRVQKKGLRVQKKRIEKDRGSKKRV